jgi:hypothetical protein
MTPVHRLEPATIALPPMTGPQMQILQLDTADERCIDVEGAPRSAKSWGIGFWIYKLAYTYPGIQVFYCRYKDEGLVQLRDVWSKVTAYFPSYLHPTWNSADQSWDFGNGSKLLFSSLKVAEAQDTASVHGKYKGKTIAVVIIEEAQEVPRANYIGLKERLSQSRTPEGVPYRYPLKIVLVHNSVDEDHWIAGEFPLDEQGTCTRDGHRHLRADLYSNSVNLGPDVMLGYEQDYPHGHTLRRTVIEGRRGVTLVGRPVYQGAFDPEIHCGPVQYSPYYPLLEGWDFGEEKPAVVWWQYLEHLGALRCLGGVKGTHLYLETFAPKVLEIRARLFPGVADVWSWCDPTGSTGNQGMSSTAVRLLQDMGVPVRYDPKANAAEVRYGAIQVLAGFMQRVARDSSPAFLMTPHCVELVYEQGQLVERQTALLKTAFEAGYIWAESAPSDAHPNVRKPKKGTRYDDLMNASEYILIGERITVPLAAQMWRADAMVAKKAMGLARAAAQLAVKPQQVGPTGETLAEAERRIARQLKTYREAPERPKHRNMDSRGGW